MPLYPYILAAIGMAPLCIGLWVAIRSLIDVANAIEAKVLAGGAE